MKWLITFLCICAIAVAVSVAAVGQQGQVQIFVPPSTQIALSLNFALLLVIGGFFLLYAMIRFISYTLRLPDQVRRYRTHRRKSRARGFMREAIVAMIEGRYGQSLRMADKALDSDESPAFNRLIAGRSAHHIHEIDKRDSCLMEAEKDETLKNAVEFSRATLFFDSQNYADADAAIERIPIKDRSPLAHWLLVKICFAKRDYAKALRLLRDFGRRGDRNKLQIAALKWSAQQHLLEDPLVTSEQLTRYWRMAPDDERTDPDTLAAFVRCAVRVKNYRLARTLLENMLSREWHSRLARLYGTFIDPDAESAQIECAENWLAQHPKDAGLLFALGQLCYRKRLWGKARNYFEASLAIEAAVETELALARLLEDLDETGSANSLYRKIALLTVDSGQETGRSSDPQDRSPF